MAEKRRTVRGERRARARAHEELVHDLEQLAQREPGGAPTHPLLVSSPAQVDVIATQMPCPLCEGALQMEEHGAETIAGVALRTARLRCVACGIRRTRYFQLGERPLH
jgi:hypothetical protein